MESNIHDKELANTAILIELKNLIKVLAKKKRRGAKKASSPGPINNIAVIPGRAFQGTVDDPEQARNLGVPLSHNVIVKKRSEMQRALAEIEKKENPTPKDILKIMGPAKPADLLGMMGEGKKKKKKKAKKSKKSKKSKKGVELIC